MSNNNKRDDEGEAHEAEDVKVGVEYDIDIPTPTYTITSKKFSIERVDNSSSESSGLCEKLILRPGENSTGSIRMQLGFSVSLALSYRFDFQPPKISKKKVTIERQPSTSGESKISGAFKVTTSPNVKSSSFTMSAKRDPSGEVSYAWSASHTVDCVEKTPGRQSPPGAPEEMGRSPPHRPLLPICDSPQQPPSDVGSHTATYWSSAGLSSNGPASALPANVNVGPDDEPLGPYRTGREWWNTSASSSTHSEFEETNDDESSQSSCSSDEDS